MHALACAVLAQACTEEPSVVDTTQAGYYLANVRSMITQLQTTSDLTLIEGDVSATINAGSQIVLLAGINHSSAGLQEPRAYWPGAYPSASSASLQRDGSYYLVEMAGSVATMRTSTRTDFSAELIGDATNVSGRLHSITTTKRLASFDMPEVTWDVMVNVDFVFDANECADGSMSVSTLYEDEPARRGLAIEAPAFRVTATIDWGPNCAEGIVR